MRDAAIAVIRAIGVETGGSNVQFAVDPATGRQVVIEMNPRVSRSSALASKATGFPIAKIAALLAVGYRLDEIANDITGETPAAFEPTLDYVVVKIPRFAFEKFPEADPVLDLHDEVGGGGHGDRPDVHGGAGQGVARDREARVRPGPARTRGGGTAPSARRARRRGAGCIAVRTSALAGAAHRVEEVAARRGSIPWFVDQIAEVVERAARSAAGRCSTLPRPSSREAKRAGMSDAPHRARSPARPRPTVRRQREALGVRAGVQDVDTCAGEFPARTPYHYSTYEERDEVTPAARPRVVILGAGPNRIGQGIEFDYAACTRRSRWRRPGSSR